MHPLPLDAARPPWRLALRVLASVLAMVIGGCGPGVGGTGTGAGASEGSLDYFGASVASVCDSDIAPLLGCPDAGSPSPGAGAAGTAVRYFADSATAPRVHLRVEGQHAELDAPCARLQFSGTWGQVPGRTGRFYGGALQGGLPLPASVTATRATGGLTVELLDADERTLQSALFLVPVAAPQAVSCP